MSKYGWPFLLFIGAPFIATAFGSIAAGLYHAGRGPDVAFDGFTHLAAGLTSLATILLLGALYLRVRNLEQDTLRLVWGCVLALSVLSAVSHLGAYSTGPTGSEDLLWFYTLSALPRLVVVLWFARRASRFSLAHAFFLAVVAGGISLPYLPGTPFYVGQFLIGLAPDILAVWLLANFDERGPRFRRVSAGLVIALDGLIHLPLLLIGATFVSWGSGLGGVALMVLMLGFFVSFGLPLLLIYLVRVRRPEAAQQA